MEYCPFWCTCQHILQSDFLEGLFSKNAVLQFALQDIPALIVYTVNGVQVIDHVAFQIEAYIAGQPILLAIFVVQVSLSRLSLVF
jgi:hypothetical protein